VLSRLTSVFLAVVLFAASALPSAAQGIKLTFPQDPEVTYFSDTWRAPRSGGRRHQGTDLMAPKGTEIYAAADGVVIRVTSSRRAGRYVGIAHADGWETYYMHLNNDLPGTNDGKAPWFLTVAFGIAEGAEVRAGQLIGWVGDSGNAEGGMPHTHFELHRNGRAVNPYPYLRAAWQRLELAAGFEALSFLVPDVVLDHEYYIR
jgi:murein DD-endopeptidase MepM/ murein hydrolase activator NlpD